MRDSVLGSSKIVYAVTEEWAFTQGSGQLTSYKLKTILNSLDEGHYAVGVMKAAKGDKQELEKASVAITSFYVVPGLHLLLFALAS